MAIAAPAPANSLKTYDDVPYESHPFGQTHPDRLAAVGRLFGLMPPPVQTARLLELGSAAGGNLVPMAQDLPEAKFVGVDLSSRQIADGQAVIEGLGLTNIELRHASILDVDSSYGKFDYIICHGVFSWVPRHVQDKILAICRENLVPNGVAYVSYNTYPGWHMRGMMRDMMCFHGNKFANPQARVRQARALIDFLAKSVSRKDGPYGILLKEELELLKQKSDTYLLHEHLEDVNEPLYFHQFMEKAKAAGLRYLGEAQIAAMASHNFSADVQKTLKRLSADIVQTEQYMDFLRNRMFRQTLLCHQEAAISHNIRADQLATFHVASPAKPAAPVTDLTSAAPVEFRGPNDVKLTTKDPLMKAAMLQLADAWPRTIPFDTLRTAARDRLAPGMEQGPASIARDTQTLAGNLLNCYTSTLNLVEFHVLPSNFVTTISDRPQATPLARFQAEQSTWVTNRRHEIVKLNEAERHAVRYLDGTRGRDEIVKLLAELVRRGVLVATRGGKPPVDDQQRIEIVTTTLNQILPRLARSALLIG